MIAIFDDRCVRCWKQVEIFMTAGFYLDRYDAMIVELEVKN